MPESPHNPAIHTPAGKAERAATIAAAGQAAANRGREATSTEGAVEAALSVAAERAAERDAGRPSELARPEPVAQHTDKPETAPEVEAAATEPEAAPEKADLNVRLKRKQREAALKLKADQDAFARQRQEFEVERAARTQERERQQRLDRLKVESPRQWLEEVGMTKEIHQQYIKELLAEGKPEGRALKAETEAQKTARELAELKADLAARDQNQMANQARARFVQTAKAEDYPVLSSIYGDDPAGLVDYGENFVQPRFKQAHNRYGTDAELLFNMECMEAHRIAKATGNEKLAKAVLEAREAGDLKSIRAAFGKPKPGDKTAAKGKPPPGPGAQSRVSQPGEEAKPMSQKERRAKAAAAGREAQQKLADGQTRYDPSYLAGSK